MFKVTFDHNYKPKTSLIRRVGHPKQKWINTQLETAWKLIKPTENYNQSNEQIEVIKNKAVNYEFPFETKLSRKPNDAQKTQA